MTEPVFRAAAPDTLRIVALDDFTAVYHRPSGITHLITAPAPEIMAILGEGDLTRRAVADALKDRYAITDFDPAAMEARLDELIASGLIVTA